jgi:hypothetical protein
VIFAPHIPVAALATMSGWFEITGDSSSTTTTLKEQVELLPEASVAVEVTIVVPTGKTEPEEGVEEIVTA